MKLKKIIETTEGLHESIASLYEKKADGKFHLLLEDDDGAELLRAKEHEKGLRQIAERDLATARQELEQAQSRVTELERAQSQSSQDLRADHERVVSKLKDDFNKEKANLESTIKRIFVGDVANRIASEIAIDEGAAELLADSIGRRLAVEMVNGNPVTRVLGADGAATNASPDDLKAEYLQMKKFAGILRASEASGGGASGGGKGGGATSKKLADLGDEERTKMARENPAEFQRLVDEARSEAES